MFCFINTRRFRFLLVHPQTAVNMTLYSILIHPLINCISLLFLSVSWLVSMLSHVGRVWTLADAFGHQWIIYQCSDSTDCSKYSTHTALRLDEVFSNYRAAKTLLYFTNIFGFCSFYSIGRCLRHQLVRFPNFLNNMGFGSLLNLKQLTTILLRTSCQIK